MMEFGAKLSLKDGMSNTLQKNLQKQREFQREVNNTKKAIQGASKDKLKISSDTTGINKAVVQVNKMRAKMKEVSKTVARPYITVKDGATRVTTKIKSNLKTVGKMISTPVIKIKDLASKGINKVKGGLSKVGKIFTPIVKLKDMASKTIGSIHGKLKRVGGFIAKPFVAVKDGASKLLSSMGGMLKTLAKGATIAVGLVGAGASVLLGGALAGGAKLEQQQISIEHFIGVNNKGSSEADIGKMADDYISQLRNNANLTPFTTNEVIGAGTRAINIAGGDTSQAMSLLKVAEDMAALNPEKSLSDAIEAIADMKNGETERMKEFGFKISAEDIEKAGGTDAIIKNQLAPYFEGGAQKLATSASGLISTIKGKIGTALTDTGLAMIEKAKPLLEKMVTVVDKMAPKMQAIGEKIAEGFGTGVEWISNLMDKAGGISPIFSSIGSTIKDIFTGVKPIIESMIPVIGEVISAVLPVISSIGSMVKRVFPQISSVIQQAFTQVTPIIGIFKNIIISAIPIVETIISVFVKTVETLLPIVGTIFKGIGEKVGSVISFIGDHMGFIQGVFETVVPIIKDILTVAWDIISPILDIAISIFKALWEVVEFVFPAIQGVIEVVWGVLKPIFEAIADAMEWVGDAVDSVIGWFGDVFSGVFDGGAEGSTKKDDGASRAMGVNRIPYDNYPIRAHEGEMLLTKREANNYVAQTRGVKLEAQPVSSVGSKESTSTVSNSMVDKQTTTKDGRPIVIEKFVGIEHAEITKDTDPDELVDKMVTKFEKLLLVTP